jgi:hypothetical protein
MLQNLVSCPDDDHTLGSKLVAIKIKLFTSGSVVTVNITDIELSVS